MVMKTRRAGRAESMLWTRSSGERLSDLFQQKETVGRIIASVKIGNVTDPSKTLRCDALVDTGASHLVLPNEGTAWEFAGRRQS